MTTDDGAFHALATLGVGVDADSGECGRSPSTIRALSAYYTPAAIAAHLAKLTISPERLRILEPSAGSGALVWAAQERAVELGLGDAFHAVAVDINGAAVAELRARKDPTVVAVEGDFLDQDPGNFPPFDAVIANPPFTRNHHISPVRRNALKKRFGIPGSPGIWVYFLLHAMRFLRDGGKLVAIVPRSIEFANYSTFLMDRIGLSFEDVQIFNFRDRVAWEGGAGEQGAILVAAGMHRRPPPASSGSNVAASRRELLEASIVGPLGACLGNSLRLRELAEISIGVVTGRNRAFVIDETARLNAGISLSDVTPVLSRARHVVSTRISKLELMRQSTAGEKTWLLTPRKLFPKVKAHLRQISPTDIASVSWFRKRTPWWKVDLGARCDGVLTSMCHGSPKFALVERGIYCTNTLYRIKFHNTVRTNWRHAVVLTMASSVGQLQSELLGRPYGAGLLKLEPSAAKELRIVPFPRALTREERQVLACASAEGDESLRDIADKILLSTIFGSKWQLVAAQLRREIDSARRLRFSVGAKGSVK